MLVNYFVLFWEIYMQVRLGAYPLSEVLSSLLQNRINLSLSAFILGNILEDEARSIPFECSQLYLTTIWGKFHAVVSYSACECILISSWSNIFRQGSEPTL